MVVTGTDTGVGKTIVTAAISAAATAAGLRVAVVKPCQTGTVSGEEGDADTIARLAAPTCSITLASYPDPLAPATAARIAGLPPLALDAVVNATHDLLDEHDLVLLEGAGGVLVSMGHDDWTVVDLASALSAPTVVVARAGLGTLNHTALTQLALSQQGIRHHVVIGEWPSEPQLVHETNLHDLPALAGLLPSGAGALSPKDFRLAAPRWLSAQLHGKLQLGPDNQPC
ncbi:MAG: dethiobiotin synthase [Acidothermaceae bacterium]